MARPGVTYTEVINAAQQITASGKLPTIEGIRYLLGTGSNSTLGQHLRTWKSKQDSTQLIATKKNIPEPLIAAVKGVWDMVISQSEASIQAIQVETQQSLTTIKQDLQQLQQNYNALQQEYHQAKQERDSLTHEKSALNHMFSESKVKLVAITEKLVGSEKHNQEKQARIEELQRQHQQIQANLEHYREASLAQRMEDQQRYEQQQNQLETTVRQLNVELSELKKNHTKLQQDDQQILFESNHFKTQYAKLEEQNQLQEEKLTQILNEVAQKNQEAKHWQEQHETLLSQHNVQNKGYIELQTQYVVALQQISHLQNELQLQRDQNQTLAHDKWVLGQEKAQLYGQLKQIGFSI